VGRRTLNYYPNDRDLIAIWYYKDPSIGWDQNYNDWLYDIGFKPDFTNMFRKDDLNLIWYSGYNDYTWLPYGMNENEMILWLEDNYWNSLTNPNERVLVVNAKDVVLDDDNYWNQVLNAYAEYFNGTDLDEYLWGGMTNNYPDWYIMAVIDRQLSWDPDPDDFYEDCLYFYADEQARSWPIKETIRTGEEPMHDYEIRWGSDFPIHREPPSKMARGEITSDDLFRNAFGDRDVEIANDILDSMVDAVKEQADDIKDVLGNVTGETLDDLNLPREPAKLLGMAVEKTFRSLRIDKALSWGKEKAQQLFFPESPADIKALPWRKKKK
jgi:hypothetical protein